MKPTPFDWSKYETVPFAVMGHSSQLGWLELARPSSPAEARQRYDAADFRRKYLLNYGAIVAEQGNG